MYIVYTIILIQAYKYNIITRGMFSNIKYYQI